MIYQRYWLPRNRTILAGILFLAFILACGSAATATPQPTASVGSAQPTATSVPSAGQPTPTAVPTTVPAKVTGKPVVDTLVVVLDAPLLQSTLDCGVTGSATVQQRPTVEYLIGADRFNGDLVPRLATEWTISEDGTSWNFKLRKNVQFHFGYGEFTAEDVVNSMSVYTADTCRASYSDFWRNDPRAEVQVIDDYEINIKLLARPEIILDYWISEYRGLPISSKAQWDEACPGGQGLIQGSENRPDLPKYCEAGEPGVQAKPSRLGPLQLVSFEEGVGHKFEVVPFEHYRITPDFLELDMRLITEANTRLALIITEEAHIGEIPRNLIDQAISAGMIAVDSQLPSPDPHMLFGGLYYDSTVRANYDPSVPWAAEGEQGRLVRQAMNKAVDRNALNRAFFEGQGEIMFVTNSHPQLPGYNPEWESRFEEMYGYDPEKAKDLLAQAGFPEGFEVPMKVFTMTGVPEMADYVEAIAGMFEAIGLTPKLEEIEFGRWRTEYRNVNTNCCIYPFRATFMPQNVSTHFWFSPERFMRGYVSDTVTANFHAAIASTTLEEQAALFLKINNELFDEFSTIPLFWVPVTAVINPDVVEEYVFLGVTGGFFSPFEYVKIVRE